jgi:hypothetical protein
MPRCCQNLVSPLFLFLNFLAWLGLRNLYEIIFWEPTTKTKKLPNANLEGKYFLVGRQIGLEVQFIEISFHFFDLVHRSELGFDSRQLFIILSVILVEIRATSPFDFFGLGVGIQFDLFLDFAVQVPLVNFDVQNPVVIGQPGFLLKLRQISEFGFCFFGLDAIGFDLGFDLVTIRVLGRGPDGALVHVLGIIFSVTFIDLGDIVKRSFILREVVVAFEPRVAPLLDFRVNLLQFFVLLLFEKLIFCLVD